MHCYQRANCSEHFTNCKTLVIRQIKFSPIANFFPNWQIIVLPNLIDIRYSNWTILWLSCFLIVAHYHVITIIHTYHCLAGFLAYWCLGIVEQMLMVIQVFARTNLFYRIVPYYGRIVLGGYVGTCHIMLQTATNKMPMCTIVDWSTKPAGISLYIMFH